MTQTPLEDAYSPGASDSHDRSIVILGGGAGTRLAARTAGLPKILVPIGPMPLLGHQIKSALSCAATRVIVLAGHGGDQVESFCQQGEPWGLQLDCYRENRPLGTAGAVLSIMNELPERFIVLYGDTMQNVDLKCIFDWHVSSGADCTLLVHPNDHPYDSDLLEVDESGRVTAFHPYPHAEGEYFANLVNAALYVVEKRALTSFVGVQSALDFGKDIFPSLLGQGADIRAYRSFEYIKDTGTPERLDKVRSDYKNGVIERASINHPAPGILFDRDGVLNEHVGYITDPAQLTLIPRAGEAVRKLRHEEYRLAVVTNQPVVARGECTEEGLKLIHNKLEFELGANRAYVDAIYYCPHHPDGGYTGEVAHLKKNCQCRKPNTGLIEQAIRNLNLVRDESWMIGDTTSDIEAARRAGLLSVLVATGEGGRDGRFDVEPDFRCDDVGAAADLISEIQAVRNHTARIAEDVSPGELVLIGGQARSGKSTIATLLQRDVLARGLKAVIVPLDSWIKSVGERDVATGFAGRHDLDASLEMLKKMRISPGRYRLPVYDRITRERIENAMSLEISSDDVVIAEGVSALVNPELVKLARTRIFVKTSEILRHKRLRDDYRRRGMSEMEIDMLLKERQVDEFPDVEASVYHANLILD